MTICSKNLGGQDLLATLAIHMPAGKGVDMNELQSQHCMTIKQ